MNVLENRKIQEQKLTGEKISKLDRQKQVYVMELQGFKNKEIADKIGVSESTIEKDLHEIRENAESWFMDISKNGLDKSMVDALFQTDLVQKELWLLYRGESKNVEKIKILNSIVSNSVKEKELFSFTKFGTPYSKIGYTEDSLF